MTPAARERRQVQMPALLITVAAWILLVVKSNGSALADNCCLPATLGDALSLTTLKQVLTRNPPDSLAWGWALMLAAMMAPMLAAPVRHVIDRSFARRRLRAVLLFLAGYVAVWMAAGVALIAVALAVRLATPKLFAPILIAVALTFLWECSPWKQRCLNRGHAHTPLAAFGIAADVDALRFGVTHGVWCVGSCWALMLLPELFPRGHLVVMALVTLWLFAERLDRPMKPRWRLRGTGKAARIVTAKARMLLQPG